MGVEKSMLIARVIEKYTYSKIFLVELESKLFISIWKYASYKHNNFTSIHQGLSSIPVSASNPPKSQTENKYFSTF